MYPKSIINFVIHMASFVACVFAMYSASVVDNAIIGCHLLFQEMAPPPIMKTNLVVDLQDHHPPICITISKNFLGWYCTKL